MLLGRSREVLGSFDGVLGRHGRLLGRRDGLLCQSGGVLGSFGEVLGASLMPPCQFDEVLATFDGLLAYFTP